MLLIATLKLALPVTFSLLLPLRLPLRLPLSGLLPRSLLALLMTIASEDTPLPTVLLVDDDIDVLAANARFLRINHFEVIVANSADKALEYLETTSVTVVVTDLRMPGKDGIDFARDARALHPLLPILFFSGFARVPDVVTAMKLGAVDFLEKPVDPEELLSRLQDIVDPGSIAINTQRAAFDLGDSSIEFRHRVLAYEKYLIETCLKKNEGKISAVLDELKINRRTLNEKMSRLGISKKSGLPGHKNPGV